MFARTAEGIVVIHVAIADETDEIRALKLPARHGAIPEAL
jgi:hypothetical protein